MSLWDDLFPDGMPPYVLVMSDPAVYADRTGPDAHDEEEEDDAEATLCGHCKLPADDCRCD